ncbi:MAG: hypothetical protein J6T08_04885, partial [Lentisphaeria bacterium]|nr:hypothetical protein [Lentisphaeria bacterium]
FYRPLFIFENSKMKSVTEKGLGKGGGVWGGGKRPFLKRAFPTPQLPQPFLPTCIKRGLPPRV